MYKTKQRTRIIKLTPKELLQRLPVTLVQVNKLITHKIY